ncbi:MAG: signal peptide peptidase SppA [Elusimicrobiaceae bacterium]|nr:signal peptide peptidase SppA [Elusimicrobiaceae bacterium]
MTEENQDQQNTANNMQAGTQKEETIKEVPTLTSFIKQEIPQIKEMEEKGKHNKELLGIKFWLILLCVVFSCSMLSGFYLIINPSSNTPQLVEEESEENQSIKFFKSSNTKEGAVVINIRGEISESDDNSAFSSKQNASIIARRIRELADKKEVKALLLDINSPGGTVAAVQDIYNALNYFRAQKKPVVALMRDVAASGGFYIAMAADKIVAQPGTMTGSIGVIMQTTNAQELLKKIGVDFNAVKSGQNKDMGAIYKELTEEQKLLLQEMIDETYQQFFEAVRKGRPNMNVNTLRVYADGRIFTGARAQTLGFIDGLGGEEKAKEYLSELTGIKDIKVLNQKNKFMEGFFLPFSNLAESYSSLKQITKPQTPALAYKLNL